MTTGDEPTVRYGERRISQTALKQRAAQAAGALADAGVEHGGRIAIVMRNEPDFVTLSAAAGLLGAVPVPVNWHWRGDELRHVVSHSGSRVVFAHSDLVPVVETVLPDAVPLVEVPVPDEIAAGYGAAPTTGRHQLLDDWLAGHAPPDDTSTAAPLSLIYTSGTTGLAKGVLRDP